MRTSPKTNESAQKGAQTTNLKELASLWKKVSKNSTEYLSGMITTDDAKNGSIANPYLTGFFNGKKKNPNEPDIRVYLQDDVKNEVITLWKNQSKNGKIYYSGVTDEGEKLVAFEVPSNNPKAPFINIYFSNEEQKKAA